MPDERIGHRDPPYVEEEFQKANDERARINARYAGVVAADRDACRKELARLQEVMRREVAAAEQRGYSAGYSDGLADMSNNYNPNAA